MATYTIAPEWKIGKLEYASYEAVRPRVVGSNARLGPHGQRVRTPIVRISAAGIDGYGWSRLAAKGGNPAADPGGRQAPPDAGQLIGTPMRDIFDEEGMVREEYRVIEYPLLDWLGKLAGKPVFRLWEDQSGSHPAKPFRARCYDTSLYFDDLHLSDEKEAVDLIVREALEGRNLGHAAFKLKVGRGARHMPVEAGTRRDIAVVNGVRKALGPEAGIMIDANNGYNLNITKRVLSETASSRLYWLEEPFHEDEILYEDLKSWMKVNGIATRIADGEGAAHPKLIEWAKKGLVDIIQMDIRSFGFTNWMILARELDGAGVGSAPHNYGGSYGNYVSGHLAACIRNFELVEWDHATMEGVDASGYKIRDGMLTVPEESGFGLAFDPGYFAARSGSEGWSLGL